MSEPEKTFINGISLTTREIDIVACIICGRSNKKIARLLGISPKTVETHVKNILSKLEASTREGIIDMVEKSDQYLRLKQHYVKIIARSGVKEPFLDESIDFPGNELSSTPKLPFTLDLRNPIFYALVTFVIIMLLGFVFLLRDKSFLNKNIGTPIARSELLVPKSSVLLERPLLLRKLDIAFTDQKDIQTVILTGISGAGKTTLGRVYARQQDLPIVWEVNALTEDTLYDSFELLAYALGTNPEEIQELNGIKNIENLISREKKLLSFVRHRLRNQNEWFLLFDNVVSFDALKKYLPDDPMLWGKGRVLITTQDKNIEESVYIPSDKIIQIGYLSPDKQLELFHKNYKKKKSSKEEILKFLKNIPPYPLDTALAASYINSSKIPYEEYLKYIINPSEVFLQFQEEVMKTTSNYPKNRYKITLKTIESIIKIHQDFRDLIIFINLIDVDDIPYDLLILFKEQSVVDYFIHTLRRFSFLVQSKDPSLSSFALHKGLSQVSLAYLESRESRQTWPLDSMVNSLVTYMGEANVNRDALKMKLSTKQSNAFLNQDILTDSPLKAQILLAMGRCNSVRGRFNLAEKQFAKARDIFRFYYGDNHKLALKTRYYMALTQMHLYHYEASLKMFRDLIPSYTECYGAHDPKTVSLSVEIGRVLCSSGHYKSAYKILQESHLHLKKVDGNFLWSGVWLCQVMIYSGFYEEARELIESTLIHLAKNSMDRSWTQILLARILLAQNSYSEAINKLEKVIPLQEAFFDKEHPRTFYGKLWLAKAHLRSGNIQKAEDILTKIDKLCLRGGWLKAFIVQALGELYLKKGDLEVSTAYFLESIELFNEIRPSEAYRCFELLADLNLKERDLAIASHRMERAAELYESAVENLSRAFNIVKENFPEKSPHIERVKGKFETLNLNAKERLAKK